MTKRKSLKIAIAAAALALMAAASSHAGGTWGYSHENKLRFTGPVALPGVTLPAGEYSFNVASPTALDVVVVRDPKTAKVFYMGFTRTVSRPRNMSTSAAITFGEAPATAPRPINTWYEIGDTMGHQFIY